MAPVGYSSYKPGDKLSSVVRLFSEQHCLYNRKSSCYRSFVSLFSGAKLALEIVNRNPNILPNHDLEMVVIDSQCQPGIALKEFIRYVGKRSAIPIAGVLGKLIIFNLLLQIHVL